jgi:homoserine kinase
MAVNALFGSPLSKAQLVHAGLAAEAAVSGFHADNVAPALMGGFVLVRSTEPLDVRGLTYGGAAGCVSGDGAATPAPAAPAPLWFALVNPVFEAPTAAMRAALPPMVPFKDAVSNAGAGGALIAGILAGDPALVGLALGSDALVEPVRGPLIPGFAAVKAAAGKAGAYGCTISGAGPTCVAVVPDEATGRAVCAAMSAAFVEAGGLQVNSARVAALDPVGARVVVV